MTKQEKRYVETELEDIKYELEGSLQKARELIDRLISKYGKEARIDIGIEYDYGSESVYTKVYGKRLETDEEFDARVLHEMRARQAQEARDQAEYDRLLKKYGPMVK